MREVGYHPHSGLCRLRGEEILLIDYALAPDLQIELLAGVLAGHDLGAVSLSDDAKRLLGKVDASPAS